MPYMIALEGEVSGWQSVFTTLTSEISVASVAGVLATVCAVTVGFAFMWWAVKKASRMLMQAMKKGKVGP